MSRLAATTIVFGAVLLVAAVVLLGLGLGRRIYDHVDTTTATTWVETQSTLPTGFDPAKIAPPATDPPPSRAAEHARSAPTDPRDVFLRVADCESGDWIHHTDGTTTFVAGSARWDDQRGGYEGGLHFLNSTWLRAGGARYAAHAFLATAAQQIEIARAWLARTSWARWPKCSRLVGAR